MADTVRDVLIRLKIQTDSNKVQLPDLAPFKKQLQDLQNGFASLGTVRAGGSKKADSEDDKAAKDSQKRWEKTYDSIIREGERQAKERKRQLAELASIESEAARRAGQIVTADSPVALARQAREVNTKVGSNLAAAADAYKMAGEGALHLARGVMLLNSATDEEIQALARKFAMYTAALDVYKGTVDVVKGTVVGTQALISAHKTAAAASAAATLSHGAQAGALTGLSAAMLRARAASIAMWAGITGPWGAAAFLTLGAGIALWYRWSEATRKAAEDSKNSFQKMVTDLSGVEQASARAARAQNTLTDAMRLQQSAAANMAAGRERFGFNQANWLGGARGMDRMTGRQEADLSAQESRERFQTEQRGIEQMRRDARVATSSVALRIAGRDPREAANFAEDGPGYQAQIETLKRSATTSVVADTKRLTELSKAREIAEQNPDNQAAREKVLALEKEQLSVMKLRQTAQLTINGALQAERTAHEAALGNLTRRRTELQGLITAEKARRDALLIEQKAEANRGKTLAQRFGEMSEPDRQRTRELSAKKPADWSDEERQFMQSTGLADAPLSHLYLKRGKDSGFDQIAKNLGTFLPGTTDQAEGQGDKETRSDFLQRMTQEAERSGGKLETEMQAIMRRQFDQKEAVFDNMKELGNWSQMVTLTEKLIAMKEAEFAQLSAKLDATQGKVDGLQANTTRAILNSRPGGM